MNLHENVSVSEPLTALKNLSPLSASYQDGHLPLMPNKLISNIRKIKPNSNIEPALL